jgi:hypothetical protein
VAPQSGAKQNFYCTVYYMTLNSNCEAQRASKNLRKIVEDRVGSKKKGMSDLSIIFYFVKEKNMFQSHYIKSDHRVLWSMGFCT